VHEEREEEEEEEEERSLIKDITRRCMLALAPYGEHYISNV